ncbi:hypothetical protein E4T56_gene20412 [Termitomyces sp. T112]|nr:hypothetical protein E4T56_gene20412 [Termitomyces sp. T112]
MSSSAYSPTASRLLSPPSQPLSSKDSEGRQDCHRVKAMYCSQLSTAVAGPSGPPSGADAMQPPVSVAPSMRSKSGICPGVVRLVPEGLRVVQAEVMPEQFAEAVGWARGPPTLEWCQAVAPCASCTRQGEQCEFEEPASGVQQDTKRVQGEQVMGGPPGSVVYSPTSGAPVEQSADRSWSVAEAYLWRRVESLERLLVACEEEIQGVWEERDRARQELDGVQREQDLAQKDKDVAVRTAVERLSCLQELEVQTVHLQVQVEAAEVATQQAGGSGVQETQQGSRAGEVQAAAERARGQEEWLANEAALGWQGVLYWAREHCILLNGALAVLGSIHDGLARMPGDLPLKLSQGVMQMGRLLAGHWRRATADPRAWWEMATDMGELLPEQPKVLAAVVAQLEVFMVGRVVGLGSEEEGE